MEHRDGAARDGAARDEKNAGRRDVDAPSAGGLERDRDGGSERQPGSPAGDAHGRGGRRRRGPRRVRAHDRRRAEGSAARPGAARGRQEGRARGARDFAHIIRRRGVLHVHRGVARSIVIVRIYRREEETEIPAADGVGGDRPTPPPARPQTRQGDPTIHHGALLERQLNPRAARQGPRRPRQPRRERRRGRGGAAGDQAADKERPGAGRQGAGELPAPSVELLDEKARVLGHRSVCQTRTAEHVDRSVRDGRVHRGRTGRGGGAATRVRGGSVLPEQRRGFKAAYGSVRRVGSKHVKVFIRARTKLWGQAGDIRRGSQRGERADRSVG